MTFLVVVFMLSGFFGLGADEGNGFDPHGSPRSSAFGDAGCAIDPNGAPCMTQTLDGDEGNGFDPHG
jgi:hypothetical protein